MAARANEPIEAFEATIKILLGPATGELSPLGREWRTHAAAHLLRRLDTELRGAPRFTEEAVARSVIHSLARELRGARDALVTAAGRLLAAGDGYGANRTRAAAKAAAEAADGADPD